MTPPYRVLFLCTGNCCRSQMAEGLLRRVGGERFASLSAGSHPAGYVHPLAIAAMDDLGIDIRAQRSKHWDDFADELIDIAITLCDDAAAQCPQWPGDAIVAHWPLPDPARHPGEERERRDLSRAVAVRLKTKVEALAALPLADLSADVIAERLRWMAAM